MLSDGVYRCKCSIVFLLLHIIYCVTIPLFEDKRLRGIELETTRLAAVINTDERVLDSMSLVAYGHITAEEDSFLMLFVI